MKNTLLFSLCLFILASCSKKPEMEATPTGTAISYQFIANFKTDTFKNGLIGNHPTDSFYSFVHGDTTGIVYAGTTLYVFAKDGNDSTKGTHIAYISPTPFDTTGAWTSCYVTPAKYRKVGGEVVNQRQNFNIANRAPHFSTVGDGSYYGR